jgi:hypothetical protein
MLQRLANDLVSREGDPIELIRNNQTAGEPLVEAPALLKADDGTYILFYSTGCWNTESYDIRPAYADKVTGPYTRVSDAWLSTGTDGLISPGSIGLAPGGRLLAFRGFVDKQAYDAKRRALYVAATDSQWHGPYGCAVNIGPA